MHFHTDTPEFRFLLQLALFVGIPLLLGISRKVRKFAPPVVIMIAAGVALGPSILGRFAPDTYEFVFPKQGMPTLEALAKFALVVFGFTTGLHFDIHKALGSGGNHEKIGFVVTGLSSVLFPSLIGIGAGYWIFIQYNGEYVGNHATQMTFMLGCGIAVGVTALPVLGEILRDHGLLDKVIGKKALGYAILNDGVLWVLVSAVLCMSAGLGLWGTFLTAVLTIGFALIMAFPVRWGLESLVEHKILTQHPTVRQLGIVAVLVALSAMVTEALGVHFLLGAFILGAVMPKRIRHGLEHALEPFLRSLLLPVFFAFTGVKTQFDLTDSSVWIVCGGLSVVALAAKLASTTLPAMAFGAKASEAVPLGTLMGCKGLMEVVVLMILLNAGIITNKSFSAMVLMALITTALTKPLTQLAFYVWDEHAPVEVDDEGQDRAMHPHHSHATEAPHELEKVGS